MSQESPNEYAAHRLKGFCAPLLVVERQLQMNMPVYTFVQSYFYGGIRGLVVERQPPKIAHMNDDSPTLCSKAAHINTKAPTLCAKT